MKTNFFELSPDVVLSAVETLGLKPTGRMQQLNSYENRVYDIWLEDGTRSIAKFYRPNRWSQEAILQEHAFLSELNAEGLPTSTAISRDGVTLWDVRGLWFSLFHRVSGRSPDELFSRDAETVGARLALLHNVGSRRRASHRPQMTVEEIGEPAVEVALKFVSTELQARYVDLVGQVFEILEDRLDPAQFIRIHGDCHRGNLLYGRGALNSDLDEPEQFFFIDLDDFLNGPVAQDFWMLLPGDPDERRELLDPMLVGYERLRQLPHDFEELFEPLRALRIIHYSGWIARRWSDPSFPRLFPQFGTYLYWLEECDSLEAVLKRISI